SVGKLTNAVPDALQLCFQAFARGTLAEGAELVIATVPLTIKCHDCNGTAELADAIFLCPSCGSPQVSALSGRELRVDSLEVE
ncbi:MAG TPA: hydrogenase maturation nickel metallochaperone HypA, partial [Bacillota bacterium]|nr:hydrogenase maturation nickel metallochaperone HypA [Bacillota bacterium]